jgi:disulfide bond formation protein DsbB
MRGASCSTGKTPAPRVLAWLLALLLLVAQAGYLEHVIQHPNLHPDCPQCLEQAALDTGMASATAAHVPPVAAMAYAFPGVVAVQGRAWLAYRSRAPPAGAVLS